MVSDGGGRHVKALGTSSKWVELAQYILAEGLQDLQQGQVSVTVGNIQWAGEMGVARWL